MNLYRKPANQLIYSEIEEEFEDDFDEGMVHKVREDKPMMRMAPKIMGVVTTRKEE